MVSVPEALRVVLRETARCWIQQQDDDDVVMSSSSSAAATTTSRQVLLLSLPELVVGQRLADNVYMPEPGYPNYNASIMDGYCIQTHDYYKYYGNSSDGDKNNDTSNTTNQQQQQQQFLVIDKVYAGDDDYDNAKKQQQPRRGGEGVVDCHHLPTAYYITTGAVVPDLYDCVIPIEEIQVQQQNSNNDGSNSNATTRTIITVTSPMTTKISSGQWIRAKGCDIAPGTIVLPKHHVLDAISNGLLHQVLGGGNSCNVSVAIQPRIRVGILSTGNEIYDIHDTSSSNTSSASSSSGISSIGKIPDVNRPILLSLLQQVEWKDYCQGVDLGMVRDDNIELVTNRLQMAIETCDIVITTGGISMGETDIIEHVLVNRLGGTLHFGRLHMKPGKPTTFVTFQQNYEEKDNKMKKQQQRLAMVFAMPGNPVSATVCTLLLVQPAVRFLYYGPNDDESTDNISYGDSGDDYLDRMLENAIVHVEVQARLTQDLLLDVERPEYHRVRLDYQHHATTTHRDAVETTTTTTLSTNVTATSTGVQRSSRLLSLLNADGLAVLPQAIQSKDVAAAGSVCTVLLLRNPYGIPAPTVGTSLHLNPHSSLRNKEEALHVLQPNATATTESPLCIGIIQIKPNQSGGECSNCNTSRTGIATEARTSDIDDQEKVISDLVQTALSGCSKSGSALVVSFHVYCNAYNKEPNDLYVFMQTVVKNSTNMIDLMVIIGPTTATTTTTNETLSSSSINSSSFLYHTATANALRQQLSKNADALAMQAKQGAAAQDPTAAIYETVVGYFNNDDSNDDSNDGVLVIFLSALGLEGGLCNVRALLQHAVQIARGGADGHHQHHQEQHHT